jgi:hypothetical protein
MDVLLSPVNRIEDVPDILFLKLWLTLTCLLDIFFSIDTLTDDAERLTRILLLVFLVTSPANRVIHTPENIRCSGLSIRSCIAFYDRE